MYCTVDEVFSREAHTVYRLIEDFTHKHSHTFSVSTLWTVSTGSRNNDDDDDTYMKTNAKQSEAKHKMLYRTIFLLFRPNRMKHEMKNSSGISNCVQNKLSIRNYAWQIYARNWFYKTKKWCHIDVSILILSIFGHFGFCIFIITTTTAAATTTTKSTLHMRACFIISSTAWCNAVECNSFAWMITSSGRFKTQIEFDK